MGVVYLGVAWDGAPVAVKVLRPDLADDEEFRRRFGREVSALVQVKGGWRTILLVPTMYLAAFVWETRLVTEPSITRQLMIGAILIVMMIARPQGLLGQRRVEVAT